MTMISNVHIEKVQGLPATSLLLNIMSSQGLTEEPA